VLILLTIARPDLTEVRRRAVNPQYIRCVEPSRTHWRVTIDIGDGRSSIWPVRETPEQIVALAREASGR
jgi:hypothetical protein